MAAVKAATLAVVDAPLAVVDAPLAVVDASLAVVEAPLGSPVPDVVAAVDADEEVDFGEENGL